MKFDDKLVGVTGMVYLIKNGEEVAKANLVVDAGKAWIAGRVNGSTTAITHIAVGTNSTAAAAANTALGAEVGRKVLTVANGTLSTNTVTFETTFAEAEGNGALTEAGLLTAATGGTLVARTVFPLITKTTNDIFTVRWVLTIN